MKLPIFQFTYGLNKGKFGFVFPGESDVEVQTFFFAIALPIGFTNERPNYERINDALFYNEFYFPIDLDGEYKEVYGEIKAPFDFDEGSENIISFTATNGSSIDFDIDLYNLKSFYRLKGIKIRNLYRYVGEYQKGVYSNCLFLPLTLRNFDALNSYFNNDKGIFVGYTNNFGEFDELGLRG